MTGLIICIALYLAAQILARVVLGKGLNTLSMQEKGLFLDITASVRKWSLLFLVVIITAFLLASRSFRGGSLPLLPCKGRGSAKTRDCL
jgi:hypothetical protein